MRLSWIGPCAQQSGPHCRNRDADGYQFEHCGEGHGPQRHLGVYDHDARAGHGLSWHHGASGSKEGKSEIYIIYVCVLYRMLYTHR